MVVRIWMYLKSRNYKICWMIYMDDKIKESWGNYENFYWVCSLLYPQHLKQCLKAPRRVELTFNEMGEDLGEYIYLSICVLYVPQFGFIWYFLWLDSGYAFQARILHNLWSVPLKVSHPEANDVHLRLLCDINFDHLVSVMHINFEMT